MGVGASEGMMAMDSRERLKSAKESIPLYFPIVGCLPQRQRAALHVVAQCAEKAEQAGDEEEATRLYWYLYTEYQSLFHFHDPCSPLSHLPDYVKPPTDVSAWVTPDMFVTAELATIGSAPVSATKALYMTLPHKHCSSIAGDLDEEYKKVILARFGREFAIRWYKRQVLFSIVDYWIIRPLTVVWDRVAEAAASYFRK